MFDSELSDDESSASETELASSVLGVKGPLRFCRHSSTQKAHVVLRRVEIEHDSDDEGELPRVVRFGLFAHKRIDVKPGKEILVTVSEGQFKGHAVMLTADILDAQDASDGEETTQVAEEEEVSTSPEPKFAVPPKMRKGWSKKAEVSPEPATGRSDAEMTAPAVHVAAEVQVTPTCQSQATQTQIKEWNSVFVQTMPLEPLVDPANIPSTSKPQLNIITDLPLPPPQPTRERSLTPMDIDSRPDTPVESAVTPSSCVPDLMPKLEDTEEDMLLSPTSDPGLGVEDMDFSDDEDDNGPPPLIPSPPQPWSDVQRPKPDSVVTTATPSTKAGKRVIHNPFVSGGFVTEFVGEPRPKESVITGTKSNSPSAPSNLKPAETHTTSSSVKKGKPDIHVSSFSPVSTLENATASSSKVSLDRLRAKESGEWDFATKAAEERPGTGPCVPPGTYHNTLGIRPSSLMATAPPATTQTLVSKKPLVIGQEWGSKKRTAVATSKVNNASQRQKALSNKKEAPSSQPPPPLLPPPPDVGPPPLPPPLLPCAQSPDAPPQLPQQQASKWKRVTGEPLPGFVSAQANPIVSEKSSNSPVDPSPSLLAHVSHPPACPTAMTKPSTTQASEASSNANPYGGTTQRPVKQEEVSVSPISPNGSSNQGLFSKATVTTTGTDVKARNDSNSTSLVTQTKSPVARVSGGPAAPSRSTAHPLPAKPTNSNCGTKRDLPSSFDQNESRHVKKRKVTHPWPSLEANHTVSLAGDGPRGIQQIELSSDGSLIALICSDRTIRIWSNDTRGEVARLGHNAPVMSLAWLDNDAGIVLLGGDGIIGKWVRTSHNHWTWGKIADALDRTKKPKPSLSPDDFCCMAYMKDIVAVSVQSCVQIWRWQRGSWQAARTIGQPQVTALTFMRDGTLLGGTKDGALWSSEVPYGSPCVKAFLKERISRIDVNPAKTGALVTLPTSSCFVNLQEGSRSLGNVEHSYSKAGLVDGFGGTFAAQGKGVLFGCSEGCALVWDTKGALVYGLDHKIQDDDRIQAAASLDTNGNRPGCLITGTKSGTLNWWSQPNHSK
ncbi:hypothetical protein PQX77_000481 [Marasmius sp. AFHP31]|nr:hypothetical protein PQX77_003596 [Marasmius sp. AFHP31]KAK1236277.1 hypothetical protein PQX77_000481 [Marasmius sp. AFHP31]